MLFGDKWVGKDREKWKRRIITSTNLCRRLGRNIFQGACKDYISTLGGVGGLKEILILLVKLEVIVEVVVKVSS